MATVGSSAPTWTVSAPQPSSDPPKPQVTTQPAPGQVDLTPFDPNDPTMIEQQYLFPLPMPKNRPPREQTAEETEKIKILGELQFFLATAPTKWNSPDPPMANITKFPLPNGEAVSCIFWSGLYHITGTDIVRALSYRFEAFGRPVRHTKKWEEGVFSDLRNLKPGTDACLEEPKSPLLEFLFRMGCIRTQKKQKVFYWFSVPHDRLFLDALERDLKREKAGQEPTTQVVGEPALSFIYDPRRSLFEQFAGTNPGMDDPWVHADGDDDDESDDEQAQSGEGSGDQSSRGQSGSEGRRSSTPQVARRLSQPATQLLTSRGLFEGSPSYKRRRQQSRASITPSRFGSVEASLVRGIERTTPGGDDDDFEPAHRPYVHRVISGDSIRGGSAPLYSDDREDTPGSGTDERNFSCSVCHRAFKRAEHMKRHLRTHTNEKPYACPRCDRSFSRQDNLVQHAKTHGRYDERGIPIGTPGPDGESGSPFSVSAAPYGRYASPHQHWPSVLERPASGLSMAPPSYPLSGNRSATVPPEWSATGFLLDHSQIMGLSPSQLDPQSHSHATMLHSRRFRSATPYAPNTSSSLAQTVLTAPPQAPEQWVDAGQSSPIMSVPQGLGLPLTAPPGAGQGFYWRADPGTAALGQGMYVHTPTTAPHSQGGMVGLYPQQYGQ